MVERLAELAAIHRRKWMAMTDDEREAQNRRLATTIARQHRAQGRIEYAEVLERRAGVVPASDEPPPFDGVPEAMEVGA